MTAQHLKVNPSKTELLFIPGSVNQNTDGSVMASRVSSPAVCAGPTFSRLLVIYVPQPLTFAFPPPGVASHLSSVLRPQFLISGILKQSDKSDTMRRDVIDHQKHKLEKKKKISAVFSHASPLKIFYRYGFRTFAIGQTYCPGYPEKLPSLLRGVVLGVPTDRAQPRRACSVCAAQVFITRTSIRRARTEAAEQASQEVIHACAWETSWGLTTDPNDPILSSGLPAPHNVFVTCDSYGVVLDWSASGLRSEADFLLELVPDYGEIIKIITGGLRCNLSDHLQNMPFNRYYVTSEVEFTCLPKSYTCESGVSFPEELEEYCITLSGNIELIPVRKTNPVCYRGRLMPSPSATVYLIPVIVFSAMGCAVLFLHFFLLMKFKKKSLAKFPKFLVWQENTLMKHTNTLKIETEPVVTNPKVEPDVAISLQYDSPEISALLRLLANSTQPSDNSSSLTSEENMGMDSGSGDPDENYSREAASSLSLAYDCPHRLVEMSTGDVVDAYGPRSHYRQ
ncbi:hypothetical protein P4O66_004275 [Electrophorus voltai]|uniref:Uncharacterized protein n=1 Tax=Electrophorus voltai TaxID=2609070 RepID=A0AAD8ZNN7_9TELE|nr:hypothetical protein P4O66_004275 [Electrophorus voltai]